MVHVKAYAAEKPKLPLGPTDIPRRDVGPHDVAIDIEYCGVCHSDIHQVRDEWAKGMFPMVPGHEIVGKVVKVGAQVKKFKVGDKVGVGCFVDSCRNCSSCHDGLEQYCQKQLIFTYNSMEKDGKTPTYGGYSAYTVVDENYVLTIPSNLPLDKAAPLLCAGITTYSPMRHWKIKPGDKVGVIGLGGLGHMAIKFAAAMGAEVTVFSTSIRKKDDAIRLGAKHFVVTKEKDFFNPYLNHFDFIINTVSADIDLGSYLMMLKLDATMVQVGVPEKSQPLPTFPLLMQRRRLAGSIIGGIKETQEMLDFCGKKNITSDIELISADKINEAFERMIKGDVRYRFVIDIKTLK